ncbi:MAG: N-acetylglucosamine-6-phosphate deacetylase [Firmicutes bacterium]|nr:N-acetylglucosamine-6-phosphate deacetylase [Bacillota bacterium]
MKAILNGRILMPDAIIEGHALLFDTAIRALLPPADIPAATEIIDAANLYVAPGLVDIHIHGYLGEDASDGSPDGIRKIAAGILQNGVTSWCPTTMTVSKDTLCQVFTMMRTLREESCRAGYKGAEILGVHAEGPFINPNRKGAQKEDHILPPDAGFIRDFADILRVITLAPEIEGCMAFIEEIARETNILLSMGHTDASFETAMHAVGRGIGHVTHTFNAMTPLNHRAPGVVGAALAAPVTAELIADMFHVHPGLFPLAAKAKGDKLVLITDCTRAGGLADGKYDLGGQNIFVKGIECRLADGTIAGSVLKLNDAVANMAANAGLPLFEAVNMASRNPARAIGETRKGTLEAGKDADIILCDDTFAVRRTIVRGATAFSA